jgi:hypothetical protein
MSVDEYKIAFKPIVARPIMATFQFRVMPFELTNAPATLDVS